MEIKKAFNALVNLSLTVHSNKQATKEKLDKIRESAAKKLDLFDKEDKVDIKQVKSGIMVKAILLELEGKNQLEEDLNLQDEYTKLIKENDIKKSDINAYGIQVGETKEATSELNSHKKLAASDLDTTEYLILLELVDEAVQEFIEKEDSTDKKRKRVFSAEELEDYLKKKKELKKLIST